MIAVARLYPVIQSAAAEDPPRRCFAPCVFSLHRLATAGYTAPMSDRSSLRATFAAGCFWGVEELFRRLAGVTSTRVGYTGGHTADPTYREVCGGQTGHAEAVEIEFDQSRISYRKLLETFWDNHDPTTKNRQGPDVGSQYRSTIFCHDQEQIKQAEQSKIARDEAGLFGQPIVTEIQSATTFYPAEEYHQRYLHRRSQGGCDLGIS